MNINKNLKKRRPVLEDIGKITGFSMKTVSRVVNNENSVKVATREKILKAIKEYGYKPNILARGLASNKTFTFGLVMSEITNPSISLEIKIFQEELNGTGYSMLLCLADTPLGNTNNCIDLLLNKNVDGIIFHTIASLPKENLKSLDNINTPYVLIMRKKSNFKTDYVGVDNEYGSLMMMEYLFNLGYREVGFIKGIENISVSIERFNGYKAFIGKNGMIYKESLVEVGNFDYEGGYHAAKKLIKRNPNMQVMFCASDYMAMGALDAATVLKKKVPEDLAIVGYDDIPQAQYKNINLTTIRIPFNGVIKNALDILFNKINTGDKKKKNIILAPELIIRDTCGHKKSMFNS